MEAAGRQHQYLLAATTVRSGARDFASETGDSEAPALSPLEERAKMRAVAGRNHARLVIKRDRDPLATLASIYRTQRTSPSEDEVNMLLRRLGGCESGEEALRLVRELKEKLGVEPTAGMLQVLASKMGSKGKLRAVELLLLNAKEEFGVTPDKDTIHRLARRYAEEHKFANALRWVDTAREKFGAEPEAFLLNYILFFMTSRGNLEMAIEVVDAMQEKYGCQPSEATIGAIFNGYKRRGMPDDAKELFEAMGERYGVAPSIRHFQALLRVLTLSGQSDEAVALTFEAKERYGMTPNKHCLSALVVALASTNRMSKAEEIAAAFVEKEWVGADASNPILANAHLRFGDEAKGYQLAQEGYRDGPVYFTLVQKASEMEDLEEVERLFEEMIERGISPSPSSWLWRLEAAKAVKGEEGMAGVVDSMAKARVWPSVVFKQRLHELRRKELPRKRYNRLTEEQLQDRLVSLYGVDRKETDEDGDESIGGGWSGGDAYAPSYGGIEDAYEYSE